MPSYVVNLAKSARKELEALDPHVIKRIFPKLENLSGNPRPAGCTKLHGNNDLWRIRIGDYRVVYSIDDTNYIVDITGIRHRKEAYR